MIPHQKFLESLKNKKCLEHLEILGEYINKNTSILVRCKHCNRKYYLKPYSIRGNISGCVKCFNENKENNILEEIYNNKHIKILGKYINNETPILIECLKCEVCLNENGRQRYIQPKTIISNINGCSYNSNKQRKSFITHDQFIESLKNTECLKHIKILGTYTHSETKILVRCLYCGKEFKANSYQIRTNNGGCQKCKMKRIKGKTHQEFLDTMNKKGYLNDIEFLEEYIDYNTNIKCKCLLHNKIFSSPPKHLMEGNRNCPICNKYSSDESKSVYILYPEIAKTFINIEEAKKYSINNIHVKIYWKCPDCDYINYTRIKYLITHGLYCEICNDKISKPNKFMRYLLNYLNISYEVEKRFDWCNFEYNDKTHIGIYDFYIPKYNLLIEMDGGFHYENNRFKNLEKIQYIDLIKNKLALENNYKIIRINCNYSPNYFFDYIKNNIINSDITDYFCLSNIDWKSIEIKMTKSLIIEVYNKWKENIYTKEELSNMHKLSKQTINSYIKQGIKIMEK